MKIGTLSYLYFDKEVLGIVYFRSQITSDFP